MFYVAATRARQRLMMGVGRGGGFGKKLALPIAPKLESINIDCDANIWLTPKVQLDR